MKKSDFLFMMLKSELWNKAIDDIRLDYSKFRILMNFADQQAVVGLLCSTLIHNNAKLENRDVIKAYSTLTELEQVNGKINKALTELCELLNGHGVEFVVVKGQVIAACYPHPKTRVSGDIDFYCNKDNFDKAKEIIDKYWSPTYTEVEESDTEQHIAFERNDVLFEMHFCLLKFVSKSNQKAFNEMIDSSAIEHIKIDGVDVPVLEPATNILYTFLHLYHHLIELGVGLRQFCDMVVLLNTLAQERDVKPVYDKLIKMLSVLGFTNAFKAIGSILVDKLGLSQENFPYKLTSRDRRYEANILDIVFTGGNFGMYGNKYSVRSGWAYYFEALLLKAKHYFSLFMLSPKENWAVISKNLPQKIMLALKR